MLVTQLRSALTNRMQLFIRQHSGTDTLFPAEAFHYHYFASPYIIITVPALSLLRVPDSFMTVNIPMAIMICYTINKINGGIQRKTQMNTLSWCFAKNSFYGMMYRF
ncbi:hypothetical protein CIL03_15760 [Virgibacillus indicus]|uniref:Uncharacterized protein n=1 Tax=Virgibacillus indicus TaxID=2024554 RepID=A0A265N6S8_9BACI|nr:hypothetical protein [Virgibacillus indicus]OZU87547.1 hypothetical protein CIL03_15760 [Virgibacillus indicus]